MWREKWRRLTTGQKISGTIVCLCIGVMLFAATMWLKIQLNPVSFTQKEYDWLRAQTTSEPSISGPGLVKDGKEFGKSWATLVVTENRTVINIYNLLYTKQGKYLTVITVRDTDLDSWPDDARLISVQNKEVTKHTFVPADKDVFTFWDVWVIRFLESKEKEVAHGMSTLR